MHFTVFYLKRKPIFVIDFKVHMPLKYYKLFGFFKILITSHFGHYSIWSACKQHQLCLFHSTLRQSNKIEVLSVYM